MRDLGITDDRFAAENREILAHERMLLGDALRGTHPPFSLPVEYFCDEKHQLIWRCIDEIFERGEKVDRVAVANELLRVNALERAGGLTYLVSLDDDAPNPRSRRARPC